MNSGGVGLGRLVLALDRTLVTLEASPRGLDITVGSVSLLDPDDLHLPLHSSARTADLFLIIGASEDEITGWITTFEPHSPVAIMVKSPGHALIDRLADHGIATISVDPHARWERIYNLVVGVLDAARTTAPGADSIRSGSIGDLFDLAGEVARRTRGLVSIEDDRSHVLAYSSAGDEADELRRLSILGREGPPAMLAWLHKWGVMNALRATDDVVAVEERASLGLRPRLAVAIRTPADGVGIGEFLGTVWLQRGSEPFTDDAADVLLGAAAVAARIITRRRTAGTGHDELVRRLLGARGNHVDVDDIGGQLGISPNAQVLTAAFGGLASTTSQVAAPVPDPRVVSALTLRASALRPLSVTTTLGSRAYVVVPGATLTDTVEWASGALDDTRRQFGVDARAVIAGPAAGLASVAGLRIQADRVLDAAAREPDLIDAVTTVAASTTGVLLGEIVALIEANPELTDSRVLELADRDAVSGSEFTTSLRAYLDHFGDVRAAATALHVHPNTLRYRIRRITQLTGLDLDDPATRLVVALTLRARGRSE
ncbi:MAG: helix-turn-helix domain-containing protein [Gordonia sp. (in: high G+C Gram-positive bacteria)]